MKWFSNDGPAAKIKAAVRLLVEMEIPLRAAYAGYFIVLSVFPALLLILSCVRYTGLQVEDLMGVLGNVLPDALMETARPLVYNTYASASGAMAGLSAAVALWSASKGVYGLLVGMNAVYGVSEDRGYLYTRAISVVYALVFLVVMLLTLALHVYGNRIIALLRSFEKPILNFIIDILNLRFFLLTIVQSLLFTLMFMALPNRRNSFWESLPGGLLSCVGWLVFSDLYSIYVTRFSGYANIYGSVYSIAISMLWLYFCLSILFYGGALNRCLSIRKKM